MMTKEIEYTDNESLKEAIIKNIKTNIVLLRKVNGLSKREVAKALHVNENTYRIWEDPKKSSIKLPALYRIAKAYGVTLDFLINNQSNVEDDKVFTRIANVDTFNRNFAQEAYLSELSPYEKLMVMRLRSLSAQNREQVNALVEELLPPDAD